MATSILMTPLKKIRAGDIIEIGGDAFEVRNNEREGDMMRLEIEAKDNGIVTVFGLHNAHFAVRKHPRPYRKQPQPHPKGSKGPA
ncbi:hypothetical protein [Arthrobacter sp. NyZ413]|uniref:hypothetical protein n=1 Tax=Arthrobacter sp. NyZ413 TaxID=3144669 RepID=UPI002B7B63E4|nr:hypothetical protein [Arthrobacter sp.]